MRRYSGDSLKYAHYDLLVMIRIAFFCNVSTLRICFWYEL